MEVAVRIEHLEIFVQRRLIQILHIVGSESVLADELGVCVLEQNPY